MTIINSPNIFNKYNGKILLITQTVAILYTIIDNFKNTSKYDIFLVELEDLPIDKAIKREQYFKTIFKNI